MKTTYQSFKGTMLVLIKRKRYLKFVTDYCLNPGGTGNHKPHRCLI